MDVDNFDPMSQYLIIEGPDGRKKLVLKENYARDSLEDAIQANIQRQLHPEIARQERKQALRDNPLLAHSRELRKQAPRKGGRGKCIICGSPHRAIIEDIYRREGGLKGVLYRMKQAGMKGSHPAVWNHFKKHYEASS